MYAAPATLVTWLSGAPSGAFTVAVTDVRGTTLTLPARTVVRAVVPPGCGVARAGRDLFDWLCRHRLSPVGPTTEDHVVDGDGMNAIVLEIPVQRLAG
ncbi:MULTISPECIES: hypothetical protein [unclassified Micromonospora]|uniref:hypothetical protein n=1 Tax=unclassified Micromonospora TaxID=2617518 RepID=UPI0022B663F1|nr:MULTISPECIES: hypothetical protein [unclassified Micromonospora]MCZ7422596.1 hypothetical protein [Verrucosispora sp. WMMA2121]WBB90346.1 hypothetical protein O7597_25750 [Verrucosispora sp. WMMC514]